MSYLSTSIFGIAQLCQSRVRPWCTRGVSWHNKPQMTGRHEVAGHVTAGTYPLGIIAALDAQHLPDEGSAGTYFCFLHIVLPTIFFFARIHLVPIYSNTSHDDGSAVTMLSQDAQQLSRYDMFSRTCAHIHP